jgi:hypothetical protein
MDPRRLSAAPRLATGPTQGGFDGTNAAGAAATGVLEIWELTSGGGWSHPIHVHFEEGVILSRGGEPPPAWETWARKDVYRLGPQDDSTDEIEFAIRFREFAGTFMEHCHNTQHEDHAMLLRWDIEHPGQVQLMPTPIPTWDGVEYHDSAALPTFRTGDGFGPQNLRAAASSPGPGTKIGLPTANRVTAVNVYGAAYDRATRTLNVKGTAPAEVSHVYIHRGEPTARQCPGALIGKAMVNVDGSWSFNKRGVEAIPAGVCVRSVDGLDDSLNVTGLQVAATSF